MVSLECYTEDEIYHGKFREFLPESKVMNAVFIVELASLCPLPYTVMQDQDHNELDISHATGGQEKEA